jgi:eukaryotic-like serine/threonine-protein kinase
MDGEMVLPDVEIQVGERTAMTPAPLTNLKAEGAPYPFTARLTGFRLYSGQITFKGGGEQVMKFQMQRERKPSPPVIAAPTPTPKPPALPKPPPASKQAPVAKGPTGQLAATTSPSGAEAWVNGKRIPKAKTPLMNNAALVLPVGKHAIQFKLNNMVSDILMVEIKEGEVSKLPGVELK